MRKLFFGISFWAAMAAMAVVVIAVQVITWIAVVHWSQFWRHIGIPTMYRVSNERWQELKEWLQTHYDGKN